MTTTHLPTPGSYRPISDVRPGWEIHFQPATIDAVAEWKTVSLVLPAGASLLLHFTDGHVETATHDTPVMCRTPEEATTGPAPATPSAAGQRFAAAVGEFMDDLAAARDAELDADGDR